MHRNHLRNLRAFVQICFASIDEPDLKEIVNRTGLSMATVRRLAAGDCSGATHVETVQRLGAAAGLRLEQTARGDTRIFVNA